MEKPLLNHQTLLPFLGQYRRLMQPFMGRLKKALAWILLMQVLALIEPSVLMFIVNGIVSGDRFVREHLLGIMLLALLALTVMGVASAARNCAVRRVWMQMDEEMPIWCGRKLLRLPLSFHMIENPGLLLGKIIRGVYKCIDLTGALLYEIAPLVLQTAITAAILIWFNWHATLVLLPVVLVFAVVTGLTKARLAPLRIKRHDLENEADQLLGQAVTNVMTTQAFVQEEREMRAAADIRRAIWVMQDREFGFNEVTDVGRNFIVNIGRLAVVFVCALAAFADPANLGLQIAKLVFISSLADRVFLSCYRIGTIFDRTVEAIEPVGKLIRLLDEPEPIKDPESPVELPPRFEGRIDFEDVTFTYPRTALDGEASPPGPALQSVDLNIRAGETIGIAGMSGGGKSTLVHLIPRFGDPERGRIRIDGIDLRQMRIADLRRQIGYVPQEVEIYDDTVAANIAYGLPGADLKLIERAAEQACADGFIRALPLGYATKVGNRGLRLSGGQRQRLGIARALLLDPPILIFDEATSQVDAEIELVIKEAVEKLRRGRTVIIVAHRLSTIRTADRIVIVEHGRITEIGSNAELLHRGRVYKRLVEIQTRHVAKA